MNTQTIRRILALQSVIALILLTPTLVIGAESSSFKLYSNLDESDPTPMNSASYSLDEGGGTWTAFPLTGSNFQIVTAPPASSVSSTSSSEASQSQTDTGGSGGGSGGGRGTRVEGPNPDAPRRGQGSSSLSSSSSKYFVPTDVVPPIDANLVPPQPEDETVRPAAGEQPPALDYVFIPGKTQCETNECACKCPVLSTRCEGERLVRVPVLVPTTFETPLPSILLLLVAYILGYVSRITRAGSVQIKKAPATKRRKKS